MKSLVRSLMALTIAAAVAGPAHGPNVQLLVPIADAMEVTNVSDLSTTAVRFLFATEKSPEILKNLGSHLAAPKTGASDISDQRACHEASLWTLVHLETRTQRLGTNAVANIVSYYRKKEMTSMSEFECHVGNVIVTV